MENSMTINDLAILLNHVKMYNSPFTAGFHRRVVKYVDPCIDMRDGKCFSITFRGYGTEFNLNTTNENSTNPKNLFTRCMEWLESEV